MLRCWWCLALGTSPGQGHATQDPRPRLWRRSGSPRGLPVKSEARRRMMVRWPADPTPARRMEDTHGPGTPASAWNTCMRALRRGVVLIPEAPGAGRRRPRKDNNHAGATLARHRAGSWAHQRSHLRMNMRPCRTFPLCAPSAAGCRHLLARISLPRTGRQRRSRRPQNRRPKARSRTPSRLPPSVSLGTTLGFRSRPRGRRRRLGGARSLQAATPSTSRAITAPWPPCHGRPPPPGSQDVSGAIPPAVSGWAAGRS